MNQTASHSLRDRYRELLDSRPGLRIRDAATVLDVSEAELLALGCGEGVTRLSVGGWHDFIRKLKPLGRVMVLTRNESCVHEKTGFYESIPSKGDHVGLVTGKDIDLRLFYGKWAHAFAVDSVDGRGAPLRSFQFFDAAGDAVHKVYLRDESGLSVFREITEVHRSEDQGEFQPTFPRDGKPSGRSSFGGGDERTGFLDAWGALEDTHDFFVLLKDHDIARLPAVEAAEGRFTRQVDNEAAVRLLESASAAGLPIMVFTGNAGAIQIHTGPVVRTARSGGWMNVLDPDFNLHLREEGVAASWIVEKPTRDGVVTSLELFDAAGETVVQFFGERKPGKPEREDWRTLVSAL